MKLGMETRARNWLASVQRRPLMLIGSVALTLIVLWALRGCWEQREPVIFTLPMKEFPASFDERLPKSSTLQLSGNRTKPNSAVADSRGTRRPEVTTTAPPRHAWHSSSSDSAETNAAITTRNSDRLMANTLESAPKSATITKLIYAPTRMNFNFDELRFSNCPYSNCVARGMAAGNGVLKNASIVIFHYEWYKSAPVVDYRVRQRQLWLLMSHGCWQWSFDGWSQSIDGLFNASVTFRHDSDFLYIYGRTEKIAESQWATPTLNYAKKKTKGAFAYVSNCQSMNYDRLKIMNLLKRYIDVDIFGGCTGHSPCKSFDYECEANAHKQYRFFLSFENSLCTEYITEKFWERIKSDAHLLPVAVGGLSVSEYTDVAPPNSFIHAYNFTSVEALGKYLQYLVKNDEAYNRYHAWRSEYRIAIDYVDTCKLCELANELPRMPAKTNLSQWWNSGPHGHLPYPV